MELVIDYRESGLLELCKEKKIPYHQENLTVGDVLLKHGENPLFLIERKTVRDLVASLKDGRYHNQRKRWKEFMETYPDARVALWLEGDLVGCYDLDSVTKSSLVNSLLRLQSIHGILVYQIRSSTQFLQSLEMVLEKFNKDPSQLLSKNMVMNENSSQVLDMKPFKKTGDVTPELIWKSTLHLVPGVSASTATKIIEVFPTMKSFLLDSEPLEKLKNIKIGERRLGIKMAEKIVRLFCA